MSAHPSTTSSLSGAAPSPGVLQRRESGLSDDSLPSGAQSPIGGPGGAAVAATVSPPLSRRHSLERQTTELFEQLIAGEVSEEGEAPPSYAAAVEGVVGAHAPSSNASH